MNLILKRESETVAEVNPATAGDTTVITATNSLPNLQASALTP